MAGLKSGSKKDSAPYGDFVSTTDAASQINLAIEMGYPKGWQVVRQVPHPAAHDNEQFSFMDTIYAGDPDEGVDVYYNHSAALAAAVEWDPDTSTGYENNGGQNLPRKALFEKKSKCSSFGGRHANLASCICNQGQGLCKRHSIHRTLS